MLNHNAKLILDHFPQTDTWGRGKRKARDIDNKRRKRLKKKKPSDPTKHASEIVADEKSTSAAKSKQFQQNNAAEGRLSCGLLSVSERMSLVDCTSQPGYILVDPMKPVSEPGEADKSNKTINEKLSTSRKEQAHASHSVQSMKFDDLQFEGDGDHNHSTGESEAISKM